MDTNSHFEDSTAPIASATSHIVPTIIHREVASANIGDETAHTEDTVAHTENAIAYTAPDHHAQMIQQPAQRMQHPT